MHFEVDFLPVGDGERSADAIALRFGDFNGPRCNQHVIVIDGGTKESGQRLVTHINTYYGTNAVDSVLLTHSDSDHASGLTVVLEQMQVSRLLMHKPWDHSEEILDDIEDGRVTSDSVEDRFRKSMQQAHDLALLAEKKGIPVFEPFTDLKGLLGNMYILGPSREYYENLLPQFRPIEEPKKEASFSAAFGAVAEMLGKVAEYFNVETLKDPEENETSAENNSSVILLIVDGAYAWLFTGDAGVPALTLATNYATDLGIDLRRVRNLQIPHHGSRHNVGPTLLNRLIGPILAQAAFTKSACVSASKGDKKHPSKKVTNAYYRRGVSVYSTQDTAGYLRYYSLGTPDRPECVPAKPIPFYNEVEEDE
ncbi:MAG TPA: MBL fold metallo-hydrolase [Phycisphaerae bacterium]|nr:MBL fold metallo-hydrolase [Phycisphaerae bacterium]